MIKFSDHSPEIELTPGFMIGRTSHALRMGTWEILRWGHHGLSPEEATEKYDTLQVFQEVTWNYPALYGNLLLIRNAQQAACIRLPLAETPK